MKRNRVGFNYALAGLKTAIKQEFNIRIHLSILMIVFFMGWMAEVSLTEWAIIVVVSGVVLTVELINTVIEYVTDVLFPNYDQLAKQIKDISAAAVLISSITAFTVGLLILLPKFWEIIS
ncbi:diacylglycerol kinase family protein [Alkalibacillus salilacus]|uniref:Undecaprenol kinase/diacylglycerol kinase (ATP) n=1 Tax=Alkalibacillus salilacus TaxID=284582 RepID=A0ABT9VCM1_9BACI|nr:diacylglycerol kinase family protein [Alkalibacillus salilacus]MDQ0158659.1 undecaprenol kinase/diacylglycerol kinase (ATP) [Alkalibacillus salilacus]